MQDQGKIVTGPSSIVHAVGNTSPVSSPRIPGIATRFTCPSLLRCHNASLPGLLLHCIQSWVSPFTGIRVCMLAVTPLSKPNLSRTKRARVFTLVPCPTPLREVAGERWPIRTRREQLAVKSYLCRRRGASLSVRASCDLSYPGYGRNYPMTSFERQRFWRAHHLRRPRPLFPRGVDSLQPRLVVQPGKPTRTRIYNLDP